MHTSHNIHSCCANSLVQYFIVTSSKMVSILCIEREHVLPVPDFCTPSIEYTIVSYLKRHLKHGSLTLNLFSPSRSLPSARHSSSVCHSNLDDVYSQPSSILCRPLL